MSYLERNQIFSLEEDDTKSQMRDLFVFCVLQNSFFSNMTKNGIIFWVKKDHDKLRVSVLKLLVTDVIVIHYDYNVCTQ